MKKIIFTLALLISITTTFANTITNISADEALQRLKIGNRHFIKMHLKHPDTTTARRKELTKGQHPFVAILSCSDSRVPPEIIFDQGLGDIFEIRNAGNVLDEHVIGSIEYAAKHLGVNLVVVMGHEYCGAVKAAMSEEKEPAAIESLKDSIKPAVCKCKQIGKYSYEEIIKTHAKMTAENIRKDETIQECEKNHGLKVIPAYYDLETGKVEFLN